MVKAVINLGERENRIVQVVKGNYGFKNKSQAVNEIIDAYDEAFIGREVKPEYLKKLRKSSKQKGKVFKTPEELRKYLENL